LNGSGLDSEKKESSGIGLSGHDPTRSRQ